MGAAALDINHRYSIGFLFTVQLIGYFVPIFRLVGAYLLPNHEYCHAFK
jgi:hypothetical protein